MASVTESMAALSSPSSSSRFGTSVSRPAIKSLLSAVSLASRSGLPEFEALKIESYPKLSFASSNSRYPRVSKHRGSVVCEAQEIAFDIPAVTDKTWQSLVLKADGPVLVGFWAPWCGPCRMVHPVIDELAQQYAGKIKCFKLNTDDSPSIATQYGIRSIPTIMIFVNGKKKDAVIGAGPKTTLSAIIEKFL